MDRQSDKKEGWNIKKTKQKVKSVVLFTRPMQQRLNEVSVLILKLLFLKEEEEETQN